MKSLTCSFPFASTTSTFLICGMSGAWRSSTLGIGCGCSRPCTIFVHVFHLEDDFECSMEYFVQAFLLLGRAHHEALEGIFASSFLDLSISDTLSQFGLVARSFQLLSQIELCADKDARASPCGCLHL